MYNRALSPEHQKTLGDFKRYEPLFPKEAEVRGFCSADTIVLRDPGKVPSGFPNCFQFSNKENSHDLHWGNNLQNNGDAIGGLLDSQTSEHGNATLA